MSTSAAQATAFFTKVVRHGVVWTVRDEGGVPAPVNGDGKRAMPFWSSQARAARVVASVPAYAAMEPLAIGLSEFRERWLPGLEADGLLVGINWAGPTATGYDLSPQEVESRLVHLRAR